MIGALLAAMASLVPEPPRSVPQPQPEPVINTAAGLLTNCTFDARTANPAESEFHLGLCIGFIKGVTNAWSEQYPGRICAPVELDNERLRDVVVSWLRSHPGTPDAPAVRPVIAAISSAFPCPAADRVQ